MLLKLFHQNVDPKYHEQLVLLLMDLKSIVQNFLAMQHGKGYQLSKEK
jgi:hypothetical protein